MEKNTGINTHNYLKPVEIKQPFPSKNKKMKNPALSICIIINLLVGNIVLLFLLMEAPKIYHLIISALVALMYIFVFSRISSQNKILTKLQLAFVAVITALLAMMIACIFTSVANRLPMDNIITAGLKGILPTFVFALVLASPVWVPLAIVNFFCLKNVQQ